MKDSAKIMKERSLENYLRLYKTYLVALKNCEQQLNYFLPCITTKYGIDREGTSFVAISDSTANFAINRIEGKKALYLIEEIERYKIITQTIKNAIDQLTDQEQAFVHYRYFEYLPIKEIKQKLGYSENKSIYRIRRHVLDKINISLNNLIPFN